jgi:hypothetical protein
MRKILFNRDEPSAHEIKGKQDFDLVIKKYKENRHYWQSPWFYGSVGLASILWCLLFISM